MVTRMRFPRPLFAPVLLGILTAVSTSVQSTASGLDKLEPALHAVGVAFVSDGPEDLPDRVEIGVLRDEAKRESEEAHHITLDAAGGYFAASSACLAASVPA